ncbi:MAG: ferrous iron transport protein A [Magnetospirillum sp. WYHS-4]
MDNLLTLADLGPEQAGVVVSIESPDPVFKRRMMSLGMVRDADVRIDRTAPLGDPRTYIVKGYPLGLRGKEARAILVRLK